MRWLLDTNTVIALMRGASPRLDRRVGARPIGPLDTLIAAHALSLEAVLVTCNVREFRRVAGLRVENWLAP